MKKVSFNGLNEIRAIAAFSVVFHHLELFKQREQVISLYEIPFWNNFIANLGHNGVVLFFTLSGFLITYLLLVEKQKFSSIAIQKFYVRRILRIWPLYFVITLVGFVLMPLIGNCFLFSNQTYYPQLINSLDYKTLFLFLLFLSNVALLYYRPVAGSAQSWSVSVEEQFYAVWPWLVKYSRDNGILCIVLIIILILKCFLENVSFLNIDVLKILQCVSIEYMCIGALYAIALFENKIPQFIHRRSKLLLLMILVYVLFLLIRFNYPMLLSVLFGAIILLLTKSHFKNKILFYLGTISYGVYMYHPLCMFINFSLAKYIAIPMLYFNILFYISTIASTILLSHLSYYYFEIKFLKLKGRFTKISSGA